ncbi:MAG: 6-phosphofructokinase, partial [Candidatus Aminicenantes bacterium]|nr:6-phosphofructokinase [Candidatus Aminicenantes bacterium]
MTKQRIGILTGGGDVPPLNAVLASAQRAAAAQSIELVGILKGWAGAWEGNFVDLASVPIDPAVGGTVLKSSRLNVGKIADGPARILENLQKNKVSGLIVVGGEDTLSTAFLFRSLPQVLIAKTIDNDVGQWKRAPTASAADEVMNYFTLGYPTAAEKISSFVSLREGLRTTAYSHERIIIVESMGMHAGWLALSAALGHPDFIVIPEFPLDYEPFLDRVLETFARQRHLIIVVAEGARWSGGSFIQAEKDDIEAFDHPRFGGAARALQGRLKTDLARHFPTRNVNAVNPSYLYRAGGPNALDRQWAEKLGEKAVRLLAAR